jgi:hypothetical protein
MTLPAYTPPPFSDWHRSQRGARVCREGIGPAGATLITYVRRDGAARCAMVATRHLKPTLPYVDFRTYRYARPDFDAPSDAAAGGWLAIARRIAG